MKPYSAMTNYMLRREQRVVGGEGSKKKAKAGGQGKVS